MSFIKILPRGSTKIGFVVMLDPYRAMERLHEGGKVKEGDWNLFQSQLVEYGVAAAEPSNLLHFPAVSL